MNYRETAIHFPCQGEQLLGILAQPDKAAETGVVVVVGGPQCRIGSHRQFVHLSRALAEAGYPCLRFDHRGMGDSTGEARSFESIADDIAAAMETLLASAPEVRRVVLWGLCDAASAILIYCHAAEDKRIGGLVLLNPWVRSEASLARTQIKHYYGQRLFSAEFWVKFFKGQLGLGKSLGGLLENLKRARGGNADHARGNTENAFRRIMPQALRKFPGKVLLLLSERDYTAKEFLDCATSDPNWSGILQMQTLERCDIPGADHTFSSAAWRQQVEQRTLDWLDAK